MSHYTARVQLPGTPSATQYTQLHAAMSRFGLYLITESIGGVRYWLPHGFYAGVNGAAAVTLCNAIKAAADAVVPGAEVAVTEGAMTFVGLRAYAMVANQR